MHAQRSVALSDRVARWLAHRPGLTAALVVGSATLALDARTMLPTVGLWDTAEFQAIGPVLGIAHPTGFPSYTLLAWLASVVLQPFGDPALRANLLSAVLAAGGTALVAATIVLLTGRWLLGVAGGLALMAAPYVWNIGLRADAHALHFFLVSLLVWLLLRWAIGMEREPERAGRWLFSAAIVFGIAMGNHALTLLIAPGIAITILTAAPRLPRERPRLLVACAAGLVLTMVVLYAYLPIRASMDPPLDYGHPVTLDRLRYTVLAEQFRGSFHGLPPAREVLTAAADLLVGQLGIFGWLAIPGLVATLALRPALFTLSVPTFAITFLFALGYENADITRYQAVPLLMALLWVMVGLEGAWRALRWVVHRTRVARRARTLLVGSDATATAATDRPSWSRAWSAATRGRRLRAVALGVLAVALVGPSALAVRDRYPGVDASGEVYASVWLESALANLRPDGIVLSWWSYSTPLWYAQFVEGRRLDLRVIDDRTRLDEDLGGITDLIASNLGRRPVYVIRLPRDLGAVEQEYRLREVAGIPSWGPIYEVLGPAAPLGARDDR